MHDRDVNLPTQRQLLAQYRCAEITKVRPSPPRLQCTYKRTARKLTALRCPPARPPAPAASANCSKR